MSLNRKEIEITSKELKENYKRLAYSEEKVLSDLRISKEELYNILEMKSVINPGNVWKLRRYLIEMLEKENIEIYPFTILDDERKNKWFSYQKTW